MHRSPTRVKPTPQAVCGVGWRVWGAHPHHEEAVHADVNYVPGILELEDLRIRVWGFGLRAQGSGFRVLGQEFGISSLGFRI